MMKRIWLFGLLLPLLLIACGGQPEISEETTDEAVADVEPAAEPTEEAEARPTAAPRALTILADGEVRISQPSLALGFETTGKVTAIQVSVGDQVEAGQLIATLDAESLEDSVTSAELRLAQSQNSVAQAQKQLDDLLNWEPDEVAIAIAEANIISAQNNLSNAQSQDAVAGNGLVSAQISIDQANRELADAQESYDNAYSPGREWEVDYDAPVCEVIGGLEQCQAITYAERIKNDREFATTRLQAAQEQLRIAQANYQTQASQSNGNSAVGAESSLTIAEQELVRANTGPTDEEIETARLNLTNAQLVLEQDQFSLEQAQDALDQTELVAPWSGTIISIDSVPGALISAGAPVVTILDTTQLEFHTTNLSERDLAQIEAGQTVLVTLKTYPNDELEGTVVRIGTQATGVVSDAAVFPVIIDITGSDLDVRPGMTGRAEISTR